MFDKLKSLVGKAPRESRPQRENPNFVTSRSRIVSLLNDLNYQRIVIHLDLPGDAHQEDVEDMPSTFFKQVGTEKAALEKLADEDLHAQVLAAEQFKVITELYGAPLTFPAKVIQMQSLGDQEFYIINLPDKVFYPESLEYRRYRISSYRKVGAYLKQANQERSVPGVLDTLGVTNVGVVLSSENATLPYLRKGEKLSCSLMVDGNNVKFEVVVENVKRLADDKSIRVDCGLSSIGKEAQKVINGIMAEAEQFFRDRVRK